MPGKPAPWHVGIILKSSLFLFPVEFLTEDNSFPMQGTALHRFLAVICMKKRAFVFFKAFSWEVCCPPRGEDLPCGTRSGLRTAAVPPPMVAVAALISPTARAAWA